MSDHPLKLLTFTLSNIHLNTDIFYIMYPANVDIVGY